MAASVDQAARVARAAGRPLWLIPFLLFRRSLFARQEKDAQPGD